MQTPIVNHARLALALAAVALLGSTAQARAEGTSPPSAASATEAAGSPATPVAATSVGVGAGDPPATGAGPAGTGDGTSGGASGRSGSLSGPGAGVGAVSEPRGGAGAAESGVVPATPSSAEASAIAQAVHEAILQASSAQTQSSGRGTAETLAAESNTTSQLAWQVQISQCTAHCVGASQSQIAEQLNSTLQVVGRQPAKGTGDRTRAVGADSNASVEVRQIQVGCLAHCFGATTRSTAQTLAGYWQVLEKILRELSAGLARLSPRLAIDTGTVEQTSYQSQTGAGESPSQSQALSQASDSAQLQGAGERSQAELSDEEAMAMVNQTAQGIWQLQIGCLAFCRNTTQYQQAEQFNTTTQAAIGVPASDPSASASEADVTTQLIWQAQIGCLFWCYDATAQQLASAHNVYTAIPGDGPPAPVSPGSSAPTPAGAPIGSVSVAGGSPPLPPPASGGAGASAAPLPAVRLALAQPVPRHARSASPPAADRRAARALAPGARSPELTTADPIPAAAGAHAAATEPVSVLGSSAAAAGTGSGSNLADVAVVAAFALLGLSLVCVAWLRTAARASAVSREH